MLEIARGSLFSFYQSHFGISYGGFAPTPLIKKNTKKIEVIIVK